MILNLLAAFPAWRDPKVRRTAAVASTALLATLLHTGAAEAGTPEGFTSLFNGRDLTGWRVPAGDNGHWKVIDGVIDYDARSEAPGDKHLWTEREFGDFELRIDWRIKDTPALFPMPDVLPDGSHRLGADGKPVLTSRPNADSGILLRAFRKAQVNIWCWLIGSGELYGYRTDATLPPGVRAAATPKRRADRPVGDWNSFIITLRGEQVSVVLNGELVIDRAPLPGIPPRGRIGLQHHGRFDEGKYNGAASLVQFRRIAIREL